MIASTHVQYLVDADDRIVVTGPGWAEFAVEAGYPAVARQLPETLWDAIAGEAVVQLWHAVLDSVRASSRPVSFGVRCDGPEIRRFVDLGVEPLEDGGVRFDARLVRTERREALVVLDPSTPRAAGELVSICSWCCRVDADGWSDAEVAVRRLGLFARADAPLLTHTICPRCYSAVESACEPRSAVPA